MPMIVLVTDFGLEGPYVGQLQAVLYAQARSVPVVSLFADLPPFRARAAGYLIAPYVSEFPLGTVFVGVVDPGVGTQRRGLVVKASGQWFVGPDNGLFDVICKRARAVSRWEISYRPRRLSASFHGRDVFAPVAARLACGGGIPGRPLRDEASAWAEVADDLFEVVYIDRYGNAITGIRAQVLSAASVLVVAGRRIRFARTFGVAEAGVPFWYENSSGLVEISLREDSASRVLGLQPGDPVQLMG